MRPVEGVDLRVGGDRSASRPPKSVVPTVASDASSTVGAPPPTDTWSARRDASHGCWPRSSRGRRRRRHRVSGTTPRPCRRRATGRPAARRRDPGCGPIGCGTSPVPPRRRGVDHAVAVEEVVAATGREHGVRPVAQERAVQLPSGWRRRPPAHRCRLVGDRGVDPAQVRVGEARSSARLMLQIPLRARPSTPGGPGLYSVHLIDVRAAARDRGCPHADSALLVLCRHAGRHDCRWSGVWPESCRASWC